MSMKNYNNTIGNRTQDLLACGTVPQPTAPPHAPSISALKYQELFACNGAASHLRGTISLNLTEKNMFKWKL